MRAAVEEESLGWWFGSEWPNETGGSSNDILRDCGFDGYWVSWTEAGDFDVRFGCSFSDALRAALITSVRLLPSKVEARRTDGRLACLG